MEKEQDNNQEQDEKLLDALAQALVLIAKQLSQQEIEEEQS